MRFKKQFLISDRAYFSGSFLLRTSDIPPESAGSAFLLTTVQRFCSMHFTGDSFPKWAVNRRLYPLTSVLRFLSKFPLTKRYYLGAKGSGQSFGIFFFFLLYFLRSCYYNDLHSLLYPTDYRSWSAGSF